MVPAELWTLSRNGDPWDFLDLLVLDGGLAVFYNWCIEPGSECVYYGGHHYMTGSPIWFDEEPEIIDPNQSNGLDLLRQLLGPPVERLQRSIRERIRPFTLAEEVTHLQPRLNAQLTAYLHALRDETNEEAASIVEEALRSTIDFLQNHVEMLHSAVSVSDVLSDDKADNPWIVELPNWIIDVSMRRDKSDDPDRSDCRVKYSNEEVLWTLREWCRLLDENGQPKSKKYSRILRPNFKKQFENVLPIDDRTLRAWKKSYVVEKREDDVNF